MKNKTDHPWQTGEYLSLDTTNCLKGICAVCVVIHHLYQQTDIAKEHIIGKFLQSLGFLAVAVFFFLSGYGLVVSVKRKGTDYIRAFPIKRIVPFYINNVILIFVYVLLFTTVKGGVSHQEFIQSFFWGGTVVKNGWYLQVILMFYISFYSV